MTRKWHGMAILAVLAALLVAGCTPALPLEPPESAVETKLTASTIPPAGKVGEKMEFGWGITAEEGIVVMSTTVRYGTESNPGELGKEVAPADTTYVSATTAHISVPLPDTFTSSLYPTSKGTLYYRFHAMIAGENYWSDEYSAEVTLLEEVEEPEPEPEVPVEEEPEPEPEPEPTGAHTILVKDDVFNPDELTIKVGDTVQWKNERTTAQATRGSALLIWHSRSDGYSIVNFPNGKTFYPGETWEFTFDKQGKLAYQDAIFINAGIIGIVNVEP